MANLTNHKGPSDFYSTHHMLRRGDIIGVIGYPGRTKSK